MDLLTSEWQTTPPMGSMSFKYASQTDSTPSDVVKLIVKDVFGRITPPMTFKIRNPLCSKSLIESRIRDPHVNSPKLETGRMDLSSDSFPTMKKYVF
jgi:hypothetical protein